MLLFLNIDTPGIIVVLLIFFGLIVHPIVDLIRKGNRSLLNAIIWIVAILGLPLIGGILYYIFGRIS
ncbi:MAG: hypothetical protein EOO43_16430 [Flavobacterium sp.]|nr:MAG: hypothetical protein EOO43_16430 [Flavobacterium sp.]